MITILIFSFCLYGQNGEKYFFSYGGEVVSIPMVKYKKFLVNDICNNNIKLCKAINSLQQKYKAPKENSKLSSIAQVHCKNIGGHPVILKDKKVNSVSFCMFKDNTLIDSWSVYNHHFKGEK